MNKVLFIINVQNHIDIITNSSSELFIFRDQTEQTLKELLNILAPEYRKEYNEVVALKDASDEDKEIYYYQIHGPEYYWNETKGMSREAKRAFIINKYIERASKFAMTPEEFYSNWIERNNEWFFATTSTEALNKIIELDDPEGKIFLLFSIDENPNWDTQERLSAFAERFHLG